MATPRQPKDPKALPVLRLLGANDMTGCQIACALRRSDASVVASGDGALYPLLHWLETDGFVSTYEHETRPEHIRKHFTLTDAGRAAIGLRRGETPRIVPTVQENCAEVAAYPVVREYVEKIVRSVRWRQARDAVRSDLVSHIVDLSELYVAEGSDARSAVSKALFAIGSAEDVASRFDASYRPNTEWRLIVPMGLLLAIGLVARLFVFDSSHMSLWLTLLLGGIGFSAAYCVNFYRYGKWAWPLHLLLTAIILIGRVFFWDTYYSYVQYLFLLLPVTFAFVVYSMRGWNWLGIVIPSVSVCVPMLFCISVAYGASLLYALTACLAVLSLAILSRAFRCKRVLAFGVNGAAWLAYWGVALFSNEYRRNLLLGLLPRSEARALGFGWWGERIRETLAGARLFGTGSIGDGSQTFFEFCQPFSPRYVLNNYFLTYLIHALGWVVGAAVILLFVWFIVFCYRRCAKLTSLLGELLSSGIVTTFAMQILGYVTDNLGLCVFTPLPLPFVSNGNVSLILNLTMVGMLLALFRVDELYVDKLTIEKSLLK